MRIAQVTARPDMPLAEELNRQGHAAKLFTSNDSLHAVFARIDEFDLVHLHLDAVHLPLTARQSTPAVVTIYRELDEDQIQECYRRFRHVAFVAASDDVRRSMPWLHWSATCRDGDADCYLRIYDRLCHERD